LELYLIPIYMQLWEFLLGPPSNEGFVTMLMKLLMRSWEKYLGSVFYNVDLDFADLFKIFNKFTLWFKLCFNQFQWFYLSSNFITLLSSIPADLLLSHLFDLSFLHILLFLDPFLFELFVWSNQSLLLKVLSYLCFCQLLNQYISYWTMYETVLTYGIWL
jgi:hypothetical protein